MIRPVAQCQPYAMVSIPDSLSQELLNEIIDVGVSMEDGIWCSEWRLKWKFISSCALVCRSFLSRSQQHLFLQIHLGGIYVFDKREWERSFRSLYKIFKQSPHIAGYVWPRCGRCTSSFRAMTMHGSQRIPSSYLL